MKAKKFWLVPAAFLLIASVLNLVGKLFGHPLMSSAVKPALMPLVALTAVIVAGGVEKKEIRLLVVALLMGCVGDCILIFDSFLFLVSGMVAFLIGHVFYMVLFGGKSWKGLTLKAWIPAVIVMAAIVAALVLAIGIKGTLLAPMCVYGFGLTLLMFSGLAGVIRFRTATWWIIFCGTVLFTISDSMIAVGAFAGGSALLDFLVMATYIPAQCLLAAGAVRLSKEA